VASRPLRSSVCPQGVSSLHSATALPLDGSRHAAQFSAREGWFQISCRPIEFAVERQDGGALFIGTADELMLTV